ncbi:MAG: universal stress protein [Planctomycetota bacterium]|jgi:nucleotide-binding universal stress UspA family protein
MKVLLATDGSEDSSHAVRLLRRLPLPASSHVTVLAVVENTGPIEAHTENERSTLESVEAELRSEAEEFAHAAESVLESTGWTVETIIGHGAAAKMIVQTADDLGCDLIVLGWHGRGGLTRFLLGSVAQGVATYAGCAVLVTRPGPAARTPEAPLRLLVAYDDSAPSRGLIRTLASLPLRGRAAVHVVSVIEMSTYFRQDILERLSESWQASRRAVEVSLEDAAESLRRATDDVSAVLLERSDASDALIAEAEESGSEIVLAGSTGKTGFERLLLGSVSNRLLRHAPCSVWIGRGTDA